MKPKILEVTLRDGSYAINFQFTANDTREIAGALEDAGFTMIEIGHGIGLGASTAGKGEAAETDEAYLQAAAETLTKAKFGMFCIPGIARLEDIEMAAGYGMGFIRIGTNVTEVDLSRPFVELARKKGMYVGANFMKSYALEPKAFAEQVKKSREFGSDVIYLVDSAGGMLPSDIEHYFNASRDMCDAPVAFHGHDNLGLAIANSLKAIELGAKLIDSSLQGFGRSSGNAATEVLLVAMQRIGIDIGVDLIKTLDAGEKYIRPLIRKRGISSLDVISGSAQFHSSYMGRIRKYASKYGVDPRILISEVCKIDRVNCPEDLVESIARKHSREGADVVTARFEFDEYMGAEQK
ncbi:MAG: 4-hydroxy-2-oxovalerate aldolase [Chitinispirillaceae bacterium]|nr:4-hydroxy-2-oxovalerate aldolase [Chitinispirillaceae bacterium]